ncbi:MAG: type IX secretion system sortase PorU, partial [Candidatus Neomarinimicrobiota bacterium]
ADTPGSPKAMSRIPSLSETSVKTVTETDRLEVHEFESANFLRGGKSWYGEKFPSSGSNVTVLLNLPATKTSYPAKLTIKTRGATSEGQLFHNFSLYLNSATSPVTRWSCTNFSSLARYFTTTLQPGINILRINYTSSLNTASAYLDYVKCLYTADLESFTMPQIFWSPLYDGTVEYQITDLGIANPIIMDISDWKNVALRQFNMTAQTVKFQAIASSTQRNQYFLYSPADYKKPDNITLIENPEWAKLRDPANDYDYIIITHESLLPAAEKIATLYSQEVPADDRLKTIVVTQNQILREFNADINDPHAIRYFLKYAYENWVTAPAYVMILGDGTFDYRGIESSQGNLVMTYQVETISDTDYSTDARFVYISGSDKIMDMAVGRITVRTLSEAQDYYEKLRQYLLEPKYGEWRSRITLMADDPVRPWNNEPGHTTDSESYIARYIPKSLITNKLYLLEYPEVQDATSYGVKKPAATQALMDQLKRGTTIINYLGHGSPTVWAQEYVLYMDRDIGLIDTDGQLPFWIAGTCSWGQFDDINSTCMPEALIARTDDGGIAALAATRPTYGSPNASFISSMLQKLFPGGRIARVRLGTLLQMTLNGQDENNEKYILFGDPALYLALPYQKAEFDKMPSDTLSALKNVAITGRAKDANPDFNGAGIINVFDSDQYVTRYYLTGAGVSSSLSYTLPGEVLFRGNLNIASGAFTSSFFIPKDLNYQNLFGRIKLYGWDNTSGSELSGCYDSLKFTGNSVEIDTIGPEIKIGFEDMNFVTGDIVTSTKKLEIKIEDEHGINIAGQLGHDISVQFDEDKDLLYKMTTDFVYDTDSDSSGTILSALPDLSAGVHQISVKAWDNANNYTTATADFTLTSSEKLHLEKVVNYPNPFRDETDFVFFLTQAGQVKITVYTIRGLRIKTIDGDEMLTAGFHQINWDGRDDFGDEIARGIYIYKIQVQSSELDQKDSYIGKMVKS